jgi:hypothetical protein
MFRASWSVPVLKAAWWMGGDGSVAAAALSGLRRDLGPEAARAQAAHWMARRPQAEIAGAAGALALEANDLPAAEAFLARGRAAGRDRSGMLDTVDFFVTSLRGTPGEAADVARRFEARRDLPPVASRVLLSTVLWDNLRRGRFDEARRRAKHLLEVEDLPLAHLALWALAKRDGRPREAARHLARATLPTPQCLRYMFQGALAIGADDEAAEFIARLRDLDIALAAQCEQDLRAHRPAGEE